MPRLTQIIAHNSIMFTVNYPAFSEPYFCLKSILTHKFALEKSGDISRVCCRLFAVFWAKICVKAAKIWFNRVYGSHDGDLCLPRRSTEGHPSLSAHPWERTFAPSAMYIQREFDAYLCHFAFVTLPIGLQSWTHTFANEPPERLLSAIKGQE